MLFRSPAPERPPGNARMEIVEFGDHTKALAAPSAQMGSSVYNPSRQVGAVIGAAAVGAVMQMLEPLGIGVAAGTAMLLPVALLIVGFLAVSNFRPDERP